MTGPASLRALCLWLLVCAALATAAAAQAPGPARAPVQVSAQSGSGSTRIEDGLAGTFAQLRADSGLRALERIPDRPGLRQLTCSAAQTGSPQLHALDQEANAAGSLYKTTTPLTASAEFLRVASYNDQGADPSHRITRFSVTAWPDAHNPDLTWIGVALYWSRLRQALDRHVTHIGYRSNLPQFVTSACLSVR